MEKLKEKGNEAYIKNDFAAALSYYNQAVAIGKQFCDKIASPLTDEDIERVRCYAKCLNNRSQCHIKLGKYREAIKDAKLVLLYDHQDEKALFRLNKAFELLKLDDSERIPLENKIEVYNKIGADLKQTETELKSLLNHKIAEIKELIKADLENLDGDTKPNDVLLNKKLKKIKNKQLSLIEEASKTNAIDIKRTSLIKMDCKIEDSQKKMEKLNKIKDYIQSLAYSSSKNKNSLGDVQEKLFKTRIITGGYDNLIKAWDSESGKCVKTLKGHDDRVYALISSASCFISGSKDGVIKVWDFDSLECTKTVKEVDSRPNRFVLNKKNQLISGHVNGLIAVWRLSDMKCIKKVLAHDADCGVDDMLFIPENKLVTCSKDSQIKLWSLDNWKCFLSFQNQIDLLCIALTKEFDLVSGDSDARIKIWDLQTGECTALLQAPKTGHNFINTLVVTESNYLISGDFIGMIKIWNLATLKCIKVIKTQPDVPELPGPPDLLFFTNGAGKYFCRGISSLAILNGDEFVSCSYDGKVILWDLNRFELKKRLEGHGKAARCVSFYDFI